MKVTKFLVIILPFIFANCQDNQWTKTPPQYKTDIQADNVHFYSDIELKLFWDSLCLKKGCLTGGQYVRDDGKWGGEGCAFSIDNQWKTFLFKTDKQQLGAFLIQQLKDKSKTQTHTCPYDVATKGELAIYCLQGILKTNFFELSKETTLSDRNLYKKYGSEQNWVWHIQSRKQEIEELQRLWKLKLEQNK